MSIKNTRQRKQPSATPAWAAIHSLCSFLLHDRQRQGPCCCWPFGKVGILDLGIHVPEEGERSALGRRAAEGWTAEAPGSMVLQEFPATPDDIAHSAAIAGFPVLRFMDLFQIYGSVSELIQRLRITSLRADLGT